MTKQNWNMRHPCLVCGFLTIKVRYDFEGCEVCHWEDDIGIIPGKDVSSPANRGLLLSEAQANWWLFGVADPRLVWVAREPSPTLAVHGGFALLPAAVQLVRRYLLVPVTPVLPGMSSEDVRNRRFLDDVTRAINGGTTYRRSRIARFAERHGTAYARRRAVAIAARLSADHKEFRDLVTPLLSDAGDPEIEAQVLRVRKHWDSEPEGTV